jgi:hypothetical protein
MQFTKLLENALPILAQQGLSRKTKAEAGNIRM